MARKLQGCCHQVNCQHDDDALALSRANWRHSSPASSAHRATVGALLAVPMGHEPASRDT